MRRIMSEDGPVEFAEFDGYDFAERVLEGVQFKVWIDENDEIQVEPMPGNEEYLSGLNMKKWLEEAKIFAEETDVFCGKDNECWIEEEKPKKKARVVKKKKSKHQLKSMKDIFGGK